MINGFSETVQAINPDTDKASTWFQPAGEKHFLSGDMIIGISEVLVLAFLAGFQQQALVSLKKAGKGTAKWTFGWMRTSITSLFAKKSDAASRKDAEDRAAEAQKIARQLSERQFRDVVAQVRKELKAELLKTSMPDDEAAELANKLSEHAVRHALKRPETKKPATKSKKSKGSTKKRR